VQQVLIKDIQETIADKDFFDAKLAVDLIPIDGRVKVMRETLSPLVSMYKPKWNNTVPDINIVGMAKGGTSQLYHLLSTHKDAAPANPNVKEWCATKNMNSIDYNYGHRLHWQKELYDWHERMSEVREANPGKKIVNGCLSSIAASYNEIYNGMPNHSKHIVLVRDPADWMWAVFNYWHDTEMDKLSSPTGYAIVNEHYRSPELFHEIWLAGLDKIIFGGKMRGDLKNWKNPLMLAKVVGKENVLFVRNEDMKPENIFNSGLLERLSEFTGLSLDGFDTSVAASRTNCNANKGGKADCSKVQATSGYAITRGRPMLEKTRNLIYLRFHYVCKVWLQEYGIKYPECLDAININSNSTWSQYN